MRIAEDAGEAFRYTGRGNLVGVITKIDVIEYLARGRGRTSWVPPKG